MTKISLKPRHLSVILALAVAACAQTQPNPDLLVILTGEAMVPPVQTSATGKALILVDEDGTVTGLVEVPGMAHPKGEVRAQLKGTTTSKMGASR